MKIGVLTIHSVSNFGANLQAYSTCAALKELGHDARVIDYYPEYMEKSVSRDNSEEQFITHRKFVQKWIPLTERCKSEDELQKICLDHEFDHLLIGSDAVFLVQPYGKQVFSYPNPFWCNWVFSEKSLSGTKVSSLAASCMGTNFRRLKPDIRQQITKNLQKFHILTIRDNWTRKAFNRMLNGSKKAVLCPDPVSYLKKAEVDKIAPFSVPRKKPYLLFSASKDFFTEEWINGLVSEANKKGYDLGQIPTPEDRLSGNFDFVVDYPIDPFEWMQWITNSSGYIGMRFHPTVVALYNGIPFVALDHYVRKYYRFFKLKSSSKTYDLCKRNGYIKNWYDIRKEIPSPKNVINNLVSAPVNKSVVESSKNIFRQKLEYIFSNQ